MNTKDALELIKQGETIEDVETLDRFIYSTRDDGQLFIYQHNKHYGYEIDNSEFLSMNIECKLLKNKEK